MTIQEIAQLLPRATRGRWWPRLRTNKTGHAPKLESPGLLDPESFSRALHREWSRSQRLGLPFSVVMIASSPARATERSVEQELLALAHALRDRIRCTDLMGWHQPGKLGIILAHTPGDAAWSLVTDIQARLDSMPGLAETNTVEVYACPEPSTRQNDCAAL